MVEILLACYNSERYIGEQLRSLFEQDFGDFFITVRDDGSTDSTLSVIEDFKKKHPEKIKILADGEKNLGACRNFARLINNASGDYIMFCDHDDRWLKNKISTTLSAMRAAEDGELPVLVHTDLQPTSEELDPFEDTFIKSQGLKPDKNRLCDFLAQNTVTGCAMMINRPLLELIKNMPKEALMHDWWAGLAAAAFGKVVFVPQATILYRQHGNNTVGTVDTSSREYAQDRVKTAKSRLFATYLQARAFYDRYEAQLSPKAKALVKAYSDCASKGKAYRIKTILTKNIKKQGIIKFLAQLFYC